MDRRKFISTSALLAAASAAGSSFTFAKSKSDGNVQNEHSNKNHSSGNPALTAAAANCVVKGEACLQHCMDMLTSGDTSMSNCSKTVREMINFCQALSKAAAQNSKRLPQLAKIAMDACRECEEECRKHAQSHDVCKQCADSCAECMKLCKSVAA
jgi:Cys-rich four helix bundle protein (predicted Tat secretion target)